jgi:hypothetical protein
MIKCLQNNRFIKVSGNIIVSVPEIKFVSKNKGGCIHPDFTKYPKTNNTLFLLILDMTGRS